MPPRTAEHSDVLQMATEAFYAAAGLPKKWPRCIAFLAVHCEITELMSADAARAVCVLVLNPKHVKTSHGLNIVVDDCKTQGIEREKPEFWQSTITATTDGGDRGPEDAAEDNALVFILQKDKAQNSGS
jgi:hypothetical protein